MIWAGSQLTQWLECPTSFRYAPKPCGVQMMMTSIFRTRKCLLYFKPNGTVSTGIWLFSTLLVWWWCDEVRPNKRIFGWSDVTHSEVQMNPSIIGMETPISKYKYKNLSLPKSFLQSYCRQSEIGKEILLVRKRSNKKTWFEILFKISLYSWWGVKRWWLGSSSCW